MCAFLPLVVCLSVTMPQDKMPAEVQSLSLPSYCLPVSARELQSIELGKTIWKSYHWRYVFRYAGKTYSVTYFNSPQFKAEVTSGRCYELAAQ